MQNVQRRRMGARLFFSSDRERERVERAGAHTRTAGGGESHAGKFGPQYTGVKALWHDKQTGEKRAAISGSTDDAKTLKETYATEADALEAAQSEQQRIERGKATFSLQLARGRPELMPESPVTVSGFKPQIDGQGWLVKTVTHTLDGSGLVTKGDMERAATGY